jgi:hypothetical protein
MGNIFVKNMAKTTTRNKHTKNNQINSKQLYYPLRHLFGNNKAQNTKRELKFSKTAKGLLLSEEVYSFQEASLKIGGRYNNTRLSKR